MVFISPKKETFKYSFTLTFTCINNIVEYKALFLRLKVVAKHKIKKFHVIVDSKLIASQVITAYALKNKRLKQYRNEI